MRYTNVFFLKLSIKYLLPPANEISEGYVFTGVSVSTWGGVVCPIACWETHPPPRADTPMGADTPPRQQTPLGVSF